MQPEETLANGLRKQRGRRENEGTDAKPLLTVQSSTAIWRPSRKVSWVGFFFFFLTKVTFKFLWSDLGNCYRKPAIKDVILQKISWEAYGVLTRLGAFRPRATVSFCSNRLSWHFSWPGWGEGGGLDSLIKGICGVWFFSWKQSPPDLVLLFPPWTLLALAFFSQM